MEGGRPLTAPVDLGPGRLCGGGGAVAAAGSCSAAGGSNGGGYDRSWRGGAQWLATAARMHPKSKNNAHIF